MRYFIATKNAKVVRKEAVSGDAEQIDEWLQRIAQSHPDISVLEVDRPTFEATVLDQIKTQAQKDWDTFKATSPTSPQAILYLARAIGLE